MTCTANLEDTCWGSIGRSATGPDGIPSLLLNKCSSELAVPFAKLAKCIVQHGVWPTNWTHHWICALYKKKTVYNPENYRGIQLTAHLSKAMERFLASLFLPDLIVQGAFGDNQFAYRPSLGPEMQFFIFWFVGCSLWRGA